MSGSLLGLKNTNRMQVGSAAAIVALLTAACGAPEMASVSASEQPPAYVFRDVAVFDGIDFVEHRDVLVQGDRIESVAASGDLQAPPAAEAIAGSGYTLLPGLIDSHMHLFSAGEKGGSPPAPEDIASAFLFAGVTTTLVAAGFDEVATLQADVLEQGILAPRLFAAGAGLTAPDGHPVPLLRAMLPWPMSALAARSVVSAANADEARAQVRKGIADTRLDFFKIVFDDLPPGSPHLSLEALRAAVDEARSNGLRAIVHATLPEDVIAAIDAGAAALVHVPQRGVLSDDQVARILEARVPVITTLRMVSASHRLAEQGPTDLERQMFEDSLLGPWMAEPAWNLEGFSEEFDRRQPEVAEITETNFRKLLAAGVPLLVGTDSGVHGVFPGASLHGELQLVAGLGMAPIEALRSVTSRPAVFLDPSADFGRIARGYRADLLLVRGNPVEDIAAVSAIEAVFLGGVRLERHAVGAR